MRPYTRPGQDDLSQIEAFARIRLIRSPNIGPVTYRQLLARFGTAQAALEALPDLGRRGGNPIAQPRLNGLQKRFRRCAGPVRLTCSMTSPIIPRCCASWTARRQS